jgi:mannosyl-3-phosphoglycerate phosphatase
MKALLPVVVFADVDEAFLASQSSSAPLDLEEILAREQVTLVLCSSMTRAELETCQQELGIRCPFICESGAAVLVPNGHFPFDVPSDRELPGYHVIEFGKPYSEIVAVLHRAATRLEIPVIGFSDLSVEQVAKECGLSLSHARLAKLREYDEPFRLVNVTPDAHERLWKALRGLRVSCTYRASFEHVGAPVDKGLCVNVLSSLYRRTFGPMVTVGLGSAEHSAALLHRVKLPFLALPFLAEMRAVSPSALSGPGIPRLHVTTDRIAWVETILHLVHRARERRRPRVSAAG